ncbi:MAG: hypothetical protein C5B48_01745, partial [Candidatus Rokuibacteriota bacterium]
TPPLAIPDSNLVGVTDSLAITDDFEIADLNFRLNSLTHTFTGDLTVMLRAPNGYGTDVIFRRGEFISLNTGNGDNFINTVIDDNATQDLNATTPANAPFTGSFTPAFNGSFFNTIGISPDPIGQLGRINGLSPQGLWTVHVTDESKADTGSLNSWSLIVTPKNFVCGTPPVGSGVSIASAVLPSSRSVQVGTTATAFAAIAAAGNDTAFGCSIAPISPIVSVPAFFTYQTVNPSDNTVTGSPNTPVNIPAGTFQTFVIAFNTTSAFGPTDVQLSFDCTNTQPATVNVGLNTLSLSASSSPVADIVALAATPLNDGVVHVPANNPGFFTVATINVGAGDSITASADTGNASLPVGLSICQTNAASQCLQPPGGSVTTAINHNDTPTFAVFVTASATIPFDPAGKRIFVRFKGAGNVTHGSTSVAVTAP